MCRYDPEAADRLRRGLLDACNGRITLTVDLRESPPATPAYDALSGENGAS